MLFFVVLLIFLYWMFGMGAAVGLTLLVMALYAYHFGMMALDEAYRRSYDKFTGTGASDETQRQADR